MDFVSKKNEFADALEAYAVDRSKKGHLEDVVAKLKFDEEFKQKPLFMNMFSEIEGDLIDALKTREIKQMVSMIRTFVD